MSVSKYQRLFSIVTDQYGVDPLLDKLAPEIMKISVYSLHDVLQEERGSPDLISVKEYDTDELWWVIMTYNGIHSYKLIVEGLTLKIPRYSEVIAAVTYKSIRPSTVKRVITI